MIRPLLVLVALCVITTGIAANEITPAPPVIDPGNFDDDLQQPEGEITLQQAILLALKRNPELAGLSWETRLREIERIEAGLLPNPVAGIEVEDIAGSGEFNGIESAETVVGLSQLIELGDKRMRRWQVANAGHRVSRWKYEIRRIEVLADVAKAFYDVLSGQESLQISAEILDLAGEVHDTVSKRVEAGKVSSLEQIKSRIELSRASLEKIRAERQLGVARQKLAATWGAKGATFSHARGDLTRISEPPALKRIVDRLGSNPRLMRWAAEVSQQQDRIQLARANTIPDITLNAGLKHFNATDDVAIVAGLSIPLFVFNDKQTGVQSAEAAFNVAQQERRAAEVRIRSALLTGYERLMTVYQVADTLLEQILPGARKAFDMTGKTYRLGKLSLLDLLDAQRTYFEARRQYIDAVNEYHTIRTAVESLIGMPLSDHTNIRAGEQ